MPFLASLARNFLGRMPYDWFQMSPLTLTRLLGRKRRRSARQRRRNGATATGNGRSLAETRVLPPKLPNAKNGAACAPRLLPVMGCALDGAHYPQSGNIERSWWDSLPNSCFQLPSIWTLRSYSPLFQALDSVKITSLFSLS